MPSEEDRRIRRVAKGQRWMTSDGFWEAGPGVKKRTHRRATKGPGPWEGGSVPAGRTGTQAWHVTGDHDVGLLKPRFGSRRWV